MTKQLSMFDQGQVLPLFSQTPQRGKEQPFIKEEKPIQPSLLAPKCGACLDTGKIKNQRCICQR